MKEKIVEIVKIKQIVTECEIFQSNVFSSSEIGEALEKEIGNDTQENFVLLCLNTRNKIVSYSVVFKGTLNGAMINMRDIFQRAILSNAKSILVAHNHPSTDSMEALKPSDEDIKTTERISDSADLLGFTLLDHIIVSSNNYFSFKEEHVVL